MNRFVFALLLWALLVSGSQAQNANIDSLRRLLAQAQPDTSRMLLLADLADGYRHVSTDMALKTSVQAQQLAQSLPAFPTGKFRVFLLASIVYRDAGRLPESVRCILEARQIARMLRDQRLEAGAFLIMGLVYSALDARQAMNHYQQAIRLYLSLPSLSSQDSLDLTNCKGNMVMQYVELNHLDSARQTAQQVTALLPRLPYSLRRVGLQQGLYNNSGRIELAEGHYQQALALFHKALVIQKRINDRRNRASSHLYMAETFEKMRQPDSSMHYARLALAGSQQAFRLRSPAIYFLLARQHRLLNHRDSAQYYQEQGHLANERLYGRAKYEELSLLMLTDQQRQFEVAAEQQAYEQNVRLYSVLAGLAAVLLIAFILYRNNRQKHQANQVLANTLSDLRTTQTQLIQKEKMASLGELTAGIAHEIQNPLNFVNNFSEVSVELIAELKEELAKGDTEEVVALADDLTQNLQRITQNGQRASNIVRGMLEHSRTSTGERLPTDLNALADEYLHLAYQGQRARNSDFNCKLETHFDPNLPLVSVVSQDISRVLLNLFNNAFYAVGQRQRMGLADYQPTVCVSTSCPNGQVEIRVRDNGSGIPDAINEKIFQPFFTTKPTGEGTGLGLSLSYDIVTKGHGGTLSVESREDEGTTFIVHVPLKITGI